jgi:hypothetical protein
LYGFHYEDWETSPLPTGPDLVSDEGRYCSSANANDAFRQYGNPSEWNRYLTLGYFALKDCGEIEKLRKNFDNDPLMMHRIIWYQFMYHVDREISIPVKLNEWAMIFFHGYLEHHDALSLAMDTFTNWKSIKFRTPMDT